MKLQIPAIGYKQGGRQMVVTAMNPDALVKTVSPPEQWNPVGSQPHGNRPIDRAHRKGIAEYLESEKHFVLGAVVLYACSSEAKFVPDQDSEDEERAAGTLYLEYGANFDVGDGQHRIGAYSDVISAHSDSGDPVTQRLHASGQPIIVVIDDNSLHRAQDFTDLQRNAKPVSASMGLSMDRRQPVNNLLIKLVQDQALPIFNDGGTSRVEFLSDTPGKLSAKLFSYKTVRFVSGLVLGVNERSTKGWERTVNGLVSDDLATVKEKLAGFWGALGTLKPYGAVIDGTSTAAKLRESTYLASAGVLYAIGWAANFAVTEHGIPPRDFAGSLDAVNFTRPAKGRVLTPKDTIFAGNLVDPASGRISGSRTGWEPAAQLILDQVLAAK